MSDLTSILNAALPGRKSPTAAQPREMPEHRGEYTAERYQKGDRRTEANRLPASGEPLPDPAKLSVQAKYALKLLVEAPYHVVQAYGTGVTAGSFRALVRRGLAVRLEYPGNLPSDYKLTREGRKMWRKHFRV